MLYNGDTYLFETTARITSVTFITENDDREEGKEKIVVMFDQTVFYPQGGGQPSDIGTVYLLDTNHDNSEGCIPLINVTMVRMDVTSGKVLHEGWIASPHCRNAAVIGQQVKMVIDSSLRLLHGRIHSAGHLMDHALQLLRIPLKGTKGYHFPAGPYVEYQCTDESFDCTPKSLEDFKCRLEVKCQEMIAQKLAISTENCKPTELSPEIRNEVSEKALTSEYVRLIRFESAPMPGPCGGTHIRNTEEIKDFKIKKISMKNGFLRIAYFCS